MRIRFTDIIRSTWPARCAVFLLIPAGALFADPSVVLAQTKDKCEIPRPYRIGWSKPEKWAWTEICARRIADFNGRRWAKELNPKNPKREKLDPENPAHDKKWAQRRLSPHFLKTILTKEPFRSCIPEQGVRIKGAYFKRQIALKGVSKENPMLIERPLLIERSFFKSGAVIRRFRTSRTVSFTDSAFKKKLSMSSVEIGGNLFFNRINFDKSVRLEDAEIGGELDMRRSIFKDRFRMNTVSIKDDLLMQNAQFDKPVELAPLTVDSKLDMRAATLRELDLTGAQIKGELRLGILGDKNTTWKSYMDRNKKSHRPKLTLRDASVGTLRDTEDAWPPSLELEGFTYERFGKDVGSVFDKRGSGWFANWLAKDRTYLPRQYEYLASVLRNIGRGEMADEILLASRERERSLYKPWQSKWWGLLALKIGINYGYGLGYFLLLRFIVLFVAIGTVVLHFAGERKRHHHMLASVWDSTFYSLDMLLPLIRLRERHYTEVDLNRAARYYFYFHQVVGYLLVSILLAELIG